MLQYKSQIKEGSSQPLLQTSLKIGQRGDKYERQADAVADRVMQMSEQDTLQMQPIEEEEEVVQPKLRMQEEEEEELQMMVQRQPTEEEEEEIVQAKAENSNGYASDSIAQKINSTSGNGVPLPSATNTFLSRSIGSDFSGVKIHTDAQSVQMNHKLNARAFTSGSDIYFNKGEYKPDTSQGKKLLAHELTHVVQQNPMNSGKMISRSPNNTTTPVLPPKVRTELKRLTGNRIDGAKSYYNDALLEVKIKVGNMLKEQKASADAMFELAFGLLMPGLGKLLGRGLANVAATLPAAASTTAYKAALALLDANKTKEIFTKATDIGLKVSKINLQSNLKSITGNAEYELFFTALEKSAAIGFDKLDASLSVKTDKELGILYMSYNPAGNTSSDYVKVIEDLFIKFKNQVQPIGKKTDGGRYGKMKARWIEGSKWRALALTGEGRYFNVGSGPKFMTWISPEMKNSAIEATKTINWGRVDTVHYGSLETSGSTSTNQMRFLLDYATSSDKNKAMEPSTGSARAPSNNTCPSCHGENDGGSKPDFKDFNFPTEKFLAPKSQQTTLSGTDLTTIREWLQSIETK